MSKSQSSSQLKSQLQDSSPNSSSSSQHFSQSQQSSPVSNSSSFKSSQQKQQQNQQQQTEKNEYQINIQQNDSKDNENEEDEEELDELQLSLSKFDRVSQDFSILLMSPEVLCKRGSFTDYATFNLINNLEQYEGEDEDEMCRSFDLNNNNDDDEEENKNNKKFPKSTNISPIAKKGNHQPKVTSLSPYGKQMKKSHLLSPIYEQNNEIQNIEN